MPLPVIIESSIFQSVTLSSYRRSSSHSHSDIFQSSHSPPSSFSLSVIFSHHTVLHLPIHTVSLSVITVFHLPVLLSVIGRQSFIFTYSQRHCHTVLHLPIHTASLSVITILHLPQCYSVIMRQSFIFSYTRCYSLTQQSSIFTFNLRNSVITQSSILNCVTLSYSSSFSQSHSVTVIKSFI